MFLPIHMGAWQDARIRCSLVMCERDFGPSLEDLAEGKVRSGFSGTSRQVVPRGMAARLSCQATADLSALRLVH